MPNRRVRPVLLAFVVIVLGPGCATTTRFGMLRPTEFRHSTFAYRILRNAEGQFVSADWMVDNFYRDGDTWLPREGPNFETELSLDLDGNGTWESAGVVPTYDLLLRNSHDAGTVWARSLPLSKRFDQTELRVLARLYVESVAGAGTVVTAVRQSSGDVQVTAESNRFATEILDEHPWAVRGYEAYLITFQVANVDQLSLSDNSLWERAIVAFVRPGFLWTSAGNYDALFPTVLMLGYSNLPEDFDAHVADFYSFVESVDWLVDELADARQAILGCTTEEMVRVVTVSRVRTSRNRRGASVLSPDVMPEEFQCLQERSPAPVGLSFSARRTPYEVPPAADGETTTPPIEAPVTPPVENLVTPPAEGPATPPVDVPPPEGAGQPAPETPTPTPDGAGGLPQP